MKALRTVFLFFYLIWQLVFPVKAYAFVPLLAVGAAEGAAWTAGAASTWAIRAAAVAVGAAVAVRLDGYVSSVIAGWDTKTADDGKVVSVPPPATAQQNSCIRDTGQSCADYCSQKGFKWDGGTNCLFYHFGYEEWRLAENVPGASIQKTCPTGYVLNSGSCTLSAPAQVEKPAGVECEMVFQGGNFSADPANPACSGVTEFKRGDCTFTISGGTLNASCQGGAETISIGSGKIAYTSPSGSAAGTIDSDEYGKPSTIAVPPGVLGSPVTVPGGSGTDTGTGTGTGTDTGTGTGTGTDAGTGTGTGSGTGTDTGTGTDSWLNTVTNAISNVISAIQTAVTTIGTSITTAIAPILAAVKSIADFLSPPSSDPDTSSKDIPTENIDLDLDSTDRVFGSTSCPEPLQIKIDLFGSDKYIQLSYQPMCDFALMVRPFMILVGYITAAFIIFRR